MSLDLSMRYFPRLPKLLTLLCISFISTPPFLDDYNQFYIDDMSWFLLLFPCFVISYYLGFNGGLFAAVIVNIYHLVWFFYQRWIQNAEVLNESLVLHLIVVIITFSCSIGTGILSEKLKEKQSMLERMNEKLKGLALYDSLTGLPNRAYFMEMLKRYLNSGLPVSLMFIDLDGFKKVNDTYGHEEGDNLLKEIAKKLNLLLDENTFVGRLGGDEFIVLTKGIGETQSIEIANHLLSRVQMKIHDLSISASIGVAFYEKGEIPSAFLKYADQAMYRAKTSGKNSVFVFQTYPNQVYDTSY
ncbi:GGDEF domain-containing protein [Bacillus sp. UNC438CL73TsuS30]|uniref:GGDEF domain-containing protein n=1 Tax=Bacillus sp. UNC438CL73TsuS30 TaxID=1340434 RepID=UPI0006907287|nr:GGDEF domain-containing protein [Bacillus sp. UNC438CL73TsuS30]